MAKVKDSCEGCRRWKDVKNKMRIAELLGKAAESFKGRESEFKPTLAEYLKLVQMEKEFEEEETREITVTWVEPDGPRKRS
jgi:hypothetical protein